MNVAAEFQHVPTKRTVQSANVSRALHIQTPVQTERSARGLHGHECPQPPIHAGQANNRGWRPDHDSDFIVCYRRQTAQKSYALWIGEQAVPPASQTGQRTQILNLTEDNVEHLNYSGWTRFTLKPTAPDGAVAHAGDEFGQPSVDAEGTIYDPTVSSLASALLAAHNTPDNTNLWLTDSVARILHIYFSRTYGKLRERRHRYSSLAPWQERRAKELMAEDLSRDLSIKDLARECEISPSHFCRAFSQSTGLSPRQWLLATRVERARDLLADTKIPLAEVAVACGFFDLSHLTKIFSRAIGTTPGAWRKSHRAA
jgi:AraC-like DNA-binding protein